MTAVKFLPGLMCDKRLWQATWPHLSRAITPENVQPALNDTLDAMAADVNERAGQAPVNLVGFSMGGYLAMHYALMYPGRVSRLMIVAASAFGLSVAEQKLRRQTLSILDKHGYRGIAPQRIAQMIHPAHVNDHADVIRAMDSALGQETLISQLRANVDRPSLEAQFSSLDMPVLIVGAAQDQLARPEDLRAMADLIPNADVEIMDQCGHMIPLERPRVLAGLVSSFFSTAATAAAPPP